MLFVCIKFSRKKKTKKFKITLNKLIYYTTLSSHFVVFHLMILLHTLKKSVFQSFWWDWISGYLLYLPVLSREKCIFFQISDFGVLLDSRLSSVGCFLFVLYGYNVFEIGGLDNLSDFETTLSEGHQLVKHWYISSATFKSFWLFTLLLQVSSLQVSPRHSVEVLTGSLRQLAFDYHLSQENINIANVFRL